MKAYLEFTVIAVLAVAMFVGTVFAMFADSCTIF